MTYDQLIFLQTAAEAFFWVCVAFGAISFVIGMHNPAWLGLTKRRWVALRAAALWLLGTAVVSAAIFYTHSQPNGPHAFATYMDGLAAQKCYAGEKLPSCSELEKKCAEMPGTLYPACRILKGEDGGLQTIEVQR
ncbi:MAG: hypothetical protein RIC14_08375 [Filomicrobium sp.]